MSYYSHSSYGTRLAFAMFEGFTSLGFPYKLCERVKFKIFFTLGTFMNIFTKRFLYDALQIFTGLKSKVQMIIVSVSEVTFTKFPPE